jgi:hypothetical protein
VKINKIWSIVTVAGIVLLGLSVAPASANGPIDPEPIKDKVRPDPFPLENTLNPDSPNYDPSDHYGGEGTRFGPPGNRGEDLPELSALTGEGGRWTYHHYFGTQLKSGNKKTGARAKQEVHDDITLNDSSDYLYAPTLMAPNYCSLESVTFYHKTFSGMQRKWKVWDHTTDSFEYSTNINQSFIDDYVRNGYYYTKVEKIDSIWYACLWNYSDNVWDGKYSQEDDGDRSDGWDIWEEYDLDNNWPDLPEIQSYDLKVKNSGTWKTVTSTYGEEYISGDFPDEYLYGWNSNYYDWYVGPNDN